MKPATAMTLSFAKHVGVLAWMASTAVAAMAQEVPDAPSTPASAAIAALSSPARLAPVVVTATRSALAPFDVPASVDLIGSDTIRNAHLRVNLSESLAAVPGLLARDRQNYAQDTQLSVRGFGARSTFGIRGVRLYVDSIPATLPDGQGQLSNVDLGSADRIEVLRGPFSALYGNSSGGVIQVFTEDGSAPPHVEGQFGFGSDGTRRVGVKASGAAPFGYVVSGSVFATDGYRDHSAAERRIGNAKLTFAVDPSSQLTLVANSVALPKAEDPLGLTRVQFTANPRGVDPSATAFNTRKTFDQTQLGLVYERAVDASNTLRALVYGGHRNAAQFQSIPVGAQANALHPGGEIVLGRDYRGADLRWTTKATLAARPLTVILGFAFDTLAEDRRGYTNFIGSVLGVEGALRRDERNDVSSADPYLQATWSFAERWSSDLGLRQSGVRFASHDRYIVGANPDDSGGTRYRATTPVAALRFAPSDDVRLYTSIGTGFETPTLNEIAYRPNGATGLNLAVQPSKSTNVEAGMKTRDRGWGAWTAAVFESVTRREIVTQTNVGGRSTFQNAGATRRRGLEAAWSHDGPADLHAQASFTWLDARYRDAFNTCVAAPCAAPTVVVPTGNRIPGVARSAFYGGLNWQPTLGWSGGIDARTLSRVWVNDANSDAAAGYLTASANLGHAARIGAWKLAGFGRIDNLFARRYAGSVIVNEGNGRFFEPAPARTWTAGASMNLAY